MALHAMNIESPPAAPASPVAPSVPRPLALLPLGVALLIMLGVTVYPRALIGADGHADHRLATLVFWAMSAGLVRGVGFAPRGRLLRALLSGGACALALLAAVALRFWR